MYMRPTDYDAPLRIWDPTLEEPSTEFLASEEPDPEIADIISKHFG
jgi:hypothetical protein